MDWWTYRGLKTARTFLLTSAILSAAPLVVGLVPQTVLAQSVQSGWAGVEVAPSPLGSGVVVVSASPNGPAALAGILVGDTLSEADGRQIADAAELNFYLSTKRIGSTIRLAASTGSNPPRTVRVRLIDAPLVPKSEVYRGLLNFSGLRVWVELATWTDGRIQLAFIDGVPTRTDASGREPYFRNLTQVSRSNRDCKVQNDEMSLSACPNGNPFRAKFRWDGDESWVDFTPVGRNGSVVYSENLALGGRAFRDVANKCSIAPMRGDGLIGFEEITTYSTTLAQQAQNSFGSDATRPPDLSALRADRQRQFSVLGFNSEEQRRINYIDERLDAYAKAFESSSHFANLLRNQKREYLQTIQNTPRRVAAVQRINEIDQTFATYYDPVFVNARFGEIRDFISNNYAPYIANIRGAIRNSSGVPMTSLIALEAALPAVTECEQSLSLVPNNLGETLSRQFTARAAEFASSITRTTQGATRTSELQAVLSAYEKSDMLKSALASVGQGGVLTSASQRIAQLRQGEEDTRRQVAARERQLQDAENARVQAQRDASARAQQARNAAAAQRQARLASAPTGARGAPTARQIRDALVYEKTYGVTTGADALGLVSRSADYDSGVSSVAMFGFNVSVGYDVSSANCRSSGGGAYRCSYSITQTPSLGVPTTFNSTHTFAFSGGRWRSSSYQQDLRSQSQQASSSSSSRPYDCIVTGFGTAQGPGLTSMSTGSSVGC